MWLKLNSRHCWPVLRLRFIAMLAWLCWGIWEFTDSQLRSPYNIHLEIVICLPTKHLGVSMNSFKGVHVFQIELEFEKIGFWGEGKNGVPREKPLGARERTNNKLNPHMALMLGFEPRSHWWAASPPQMHHPCSPHCHFTLLMLIKCSALYPTLHFDKYRWVF